MDKKAAAMASREQGKGAEYSFQQRMGIKDKFVISLCTSNINILVLVHNTTITLHVHTL